MNLFGFIVQKRPFKKNIFSHFFNWVKQGFLMAFFEQKKTKKHSYVTHI